jgi:hypothetical protein
MKIPNALVLINYFDLFKSKVYFKVYVFSSVPQTLLHSLSDVRGLTPRVTTVQLYFANFQLS